jgi:hypothetical protein
MHTEDNFFRRVESTKFTIELRGTLKKETTTDVRLVKTEHMTTADMRGNTLLFGVINRRVSKVLSHNTLH